MNTNLRKSKYLALLLVLLLPACWTGAIEVTGGHITTLMNGRIEYYAEVLGPDIRVTKAIYGGIVYDLSVLPEDGKLVCDFEKLPGTAVTDMATCKVK